MKTKMKGKEKGKAIIGIAMAAIMLASVFAAMVPMVTSREAAGDIEDGDTLFIGEHKLDFVAALGAATSLKKVEDGTVVEIISIPDADDFLIPEGVETGGYEVRDVNDGRIANVTIKNPEITGKIFIKGSVDSIVDKTIPAGTEITIRASPNFGGLMNDSVPGGEWSKIKIKLIDPDGIETVYPEPASTSEIEKDFDTDGWDTGTWKVKIVSDKGTCNEVDVASPVYEFTVRSEELSIEAKEDEVGKGEDIILTINGNPNYGYQFAIEDLEAGEEPMIQATAGVVPDAACTRAVVTMSSGGTRDVKINTTIANEKTYTMHVWDAADLDEEDETDVKVVEAEVTFDMVASAVIGAEVTIKGTVTAGDYVDIVIEDGNKVFDQVSVDENGEFEEDWDTEGLTKGSYTIDVYINCPIDTEDPADYGGICGDEDGSTSIRLVTGELTAEQSRNVIAEEDDYTVEGTATGVDDVDIILIGPDGFPPFVGAVTEADVTIENGLEITDGSVTDDEFSEDIKMEKDLDTGMWIALVLSPGRDGHYEATVADVGAGDLNYARLGLDLDGKNQDQIVAMIKDRTAEAVGSDDLLVKLTFKVESAYIRLDPIAPVAVGELLEISGTTNREPETRITISSFAGPEDLPTVFAEVEWPTADEGVFNATIDTTGAAVGTYTLEADDGDESTDTVTVEIQTEVPVVEPTVEPTEVPTKVPTEVPTEVPTKVPTEEPEPTPTEPPGFEAIFAIAGLLSIAYLVLRRRK